MKPINPKTFLGYFTGAMVVYIFWVILDVIFGDGFDWIFFFLYWDLMMIWILILHKVRGDMASL